MIRMKQYSARELIEWQKRPLTLKEAEDLLAHLDHLYSIVREAKLVLASADVHGRNITYHEDQISHDPYSRKRKPIQDTEET